jgi:hypothetical protein
MLMPAPSGSVPDVIVEEGTVSKNLSSPTMKEGIWQIEPGRFLLRGGSKSGRFLVEDGRWIRLERNPLAENSRLAVHFMASVLPVLLQQRGLLVLHANSVMTPYGAVAISGESGAGKTTTIAGMLSKGCTLLADDITVLRLSDANKIEVVPGPPQLHLCEDTAEMFGYDISGVPRYPWRRMKAAVPVHEIMELAPAPLKRIYLLKTVSSGGLRISVLTGKDKFSGLQECLYGPLIPVEQSKMFELYGTVLDSVEVVCLERPQDCWSLDEVVEAILHG